MLTLAGASLTALAMPGNAMAQQQEATKKRFDIPARDLAAALEAFGRQSGKDIVFDAGLTAGKRSTGIKGMLDPTTALRRVLAGTGLAMRQVGDGAYLVERLPVAASDVDNPAAEIVVTGSRIRGASATAPVITVTAEDARNTGQATLGEIARNIPQSFGGGQNPGVSDGVQGLNNVNASAASSFNLRGLGPDATLTLLNGHRLAYDFAFQGVDIAAIPLAAVDRVDVVADGASAIYGSDAVAGVVNIILKRDFDGLNSTARLGASTDGGNTQQEYSLVGGRKWSGGGMMAVFDYQKNTPVLSRQRDYTSASQDDQTLLPGLSQHSALLVGHQRLSGAVTLSADATYNNRSSATFGARTATSPPTEEGQGLTSRAEAFSISPKIEIDVSKSWRVFLSSSYAGSKTNTVSTYYADGAALIINPVTYDNKTRLIELSGDGSLFRMNGNAIGLAVGVGYRSNSLDQMFGSTILGSQPTSSTFSGTNSSYYGFGEISIPLISPENQSAIHQLFFTGALRYENYGRGRDKIATPKIGAVFSPIDDVAFKASWGKSFKAPTLYQLYNIPSVFLSDASFYGSSDTGTAIEIMGANPELKAERATTWSMTFVTTPQITPGLRLEVSYFNIKYANRVIGNPIANYASAYGDRTYEGLITYSPTPEQIAAAIARSPLGLQEYASTPFNPADVAAILDNRNVNIANQKLHGLDFVGSYDIETRRLGRFSLSALASYLRSRQTLLPGQPETELAGTIFDPPKWRGRGSLTWSKDNVTLSSAVSHSGSLIDDRRGARIDLGSQTTADFTARIHTPTATGAFANMDFSLSALNAFNAKPRTARIFNPQSRPYDSTNDSVVGRFITFSIAKRW